MKKYNNDYVIIRGDRSGVFAGNIESRDKSEVKLTNCRRLWYWDGSASLHELAKSGTKRPNNCKFTTTIEEIEILDAIEVIKCTVQAENSIKGVKEWKY